MLKTNTNRDEYDKFMEQYDEDHKFCPECCSEMYGCTLVGYILDLDNKDDYKNLNRCTCVDCGDCHTVHDRVKLK